jgi:GntR family transcriptional repressor for pyruvate dehydrogenase complex
MFTPLGSNKSITQQVEYELTEAIRAGKYLPGQKIPTEH